MSLKTLTRANFRFLDNLPISQFILNFVRPHKTKNITDTIVYDSYVRKKTTGWFHGLDGEGRGKQMHCIMYRTADVACLPLATPKPFPSHSLQCQVHFLLILQSRCEFNDTKFTNTKSKWSRVQSYRPSCLHYGVFAKMDN